LERSPVSFSLDVHAISQLLVGQGSERRLALSEGAGSGNGLAGVGGFEEPDDLCTRSREVSHNLVGCPAFTAGSSVGRGVLDRRLIRLDLPTTRIEGGNDV
jgi:hypothetical protein